MKKYLFLFFTFFVFLSNVNALDRTCISGNCESGAGTMIFPNGNLYIGEFLKGQRHGKGVILYNDGTKYEGQWENDKITVGTYSNAYDSDRVDLKNLDKPKAPEKPAEIKPAKKEKEEARAEKHSDNGNIRVYIPEAVSKAYEKTMISYYGNLELTNNLKKDSVVFKYRVSFVLFVVFSSIFGIGVITGLVLIFLPMEPLELKFVRDFKPLKKNIKSKESAPMLNSALLGFIILFGSIILFYLYLANVFVKM